jgi:hypothetical protein
MYSPELANYVNNTTNYYWSLFDDKRSQYDYCYNVLPKIRFKRMQYIKKNKGEKKVKSDEQPRIPDFTSQREYKNNVELLEQLCK